MRKALKVHLLVIDPQVDFMDSAGSSLPVNGANEDMKRLAALVARVGHKVEDIHRTLDSHHTIRGGHPGMWRDRDGQLPPPFTLIFAKDIANGIWTPRDPQLRLRMSTYAETLEKNGNYNLMVWPEHCKIGSPGHNVQADLLKALEAWERKEFATVNYVTKGANPFTEHYGALMAEVPDPNDPSTMLNSDFLTMLQEADIVGVAGEALSHCVKSTVDQIARNIGDEHIQKFHILTDCTNPVPKVGNGPDFPAIASSWLKVMESQGMTLVSSADFLK